MLKTKTDLRLLSAIEPRYVGEPVPLTRHMVYTWRRWGLENAYDNNSALSRLEYSVWYFYDYLVNREFTSELSDERQINDLNAPVQAFRPITVFWHAVWRKHFSHSAEYDIYTEEGYFTFLTHVATHEIPQRRVPLVLFPAGLRVALEEEQPGFPSPFLSRALYNLWRSSDLYRTSYPDLSHFAIREAFTFDILIHWALERDIELLIAPEIERYWTRGVSPMRKSITRFGFVLASLSVRFGQKLSACRVGLDELVAIETWLREEVLPGFPAAVRFIPALDDKPHPLSAGDEDRRIRTPLARAKSEPLIRSDADEVDVLAIGPFEVSSGLGSGMRRSVGALRAAGASVRVLPSSFENRSFPSSAISPKELFSGQRPKMVLWHFNAEFIPEVLATMPTIAMSAYNVAYPFWETEDMARAHMLGCDMVDEFWVPSEFCARTFRTAKLPVINVGSSVELPEVGPFYSRQELGLPENAFVVMFSFDSFSVIHRKNPAAVVRAFKKAFPKGNENAILILKTQNFATAHWGKIYGRAQELLELCASDPRINFFDKTMSTRELYSLKNACDCYVSLHKSEGYGYGPAEAMAFGKPVIMTNYSANTEFATDDNCLLVNGPVVHVEPGEYLYWTPEMRWCDPDVDEAAAHLRRVFNDPDFAKALGRRAAETITRDQGVEAMAARYGARLRELGILAEDVREHAPVLAHAGGAR